MTYCYESQQDYIMTLGNSNFSYGCQCYKICFFVNSAGKFDGRSEMGCNIHLIFLDQN